MKKILMLVVALPVIPVSAHSQRYRTGLELLLITTGIILLSKALMN